jgi:predicted transcriptional regulator
MAKKAPDVRVTLRVPPELWGELQKVATRNDRSLNYEIVTAIRDRVRLSGRHR